MKAYVFILQHQNTLMILGCCSTYDKAFKMRGGKQDYESNVAIIKQEVK